MRFRSLSAIAAIATLAACGGSDGGTTPVRTVAKVTVSSANTTLNPGQTTQLTAVAADASGATINNPGIVVWASSTSSVATVDQAGKVTAVGAGAAIITADAAGVKGSLSIKVNPAGSVWKDTIYTIGIATFSPDSIQVPKGYTVFFALGFDGTGHDVRFTAAPGSPADIPVSVKKYVGVTFTTAGRFPYICPTHPQMTGIITVQ
jgi:plastocyanin